MSTVELAKRGRPSKWDFSQLQKKGDSFLLQRIGKKKAQSCRASATQQGLKVSVLMTLSGGYLVTLNEDRDSEINR